MSIDLFGYFCVSFISEFVVVSFCFVEGLQEFFVALFFHKGDPNFSLSYASLSCEILVMFIGLDVFKRVVKRGLFALEG